MEQKERTRVEYSILNTTTAMVARVLTILLGYASRVVFIHTMNVNYLSVGGLLSNILGVLALSELGMGSAMEFALYHPVASGNIPQQQALLKLFQRLYLAVAAVIVALGLGILPFLDLITGGKVPDVEHLTLIYLMYLTNSVLSYLFIGRRYIIIAHQKNYITNLYDTAFSISLLLVQIVILITAHNYILYLAVSILSGILCNLCISRQAEKMYPFLKEKCTYQLPREEKRTIRRHIQALSLHKLGSVLVNNTDNLLLSVLTGITNVGIYSNYTLIIGSVRQVLDQLFRGINASVGNLGASDDPELFDSVFHTTFFISQWAYGISAICLYELLPPFIELSFGPQFLMSRAITLILCLVFLYHGLRTSIGTFWYALGMYWMDRYKALAEAVLNLIFSIILGLRFGVAGVFAGTLLSALMTSAWLDPLLFFRHCLKKPVKPFARQYVWYMAVLAADWWLVDLLCRQITGSLICVLIGRLAVCVLVGDALLLAVHFRRAEFKDAMGVAVSFLRKYASRRASGGE